MFFLILEEADVVRVFSGGTTDYCYNTAGPVCLAPPAPRPSHKPL